MGLFDIIKKSLGIFVNNFKDMLIAVIVFSIFRAVLNSILISIIGDGSGNLLTTSNMMDVMDSSSGSIDSFSYRFISSFTDYLILGANFIAMLGLIRRGEYNIGLVFEKFKENLSDIVIVSGILALISVLFESIPVIGFIITVVVIPGLIYSYFLLEDDYENSPINSLMNSYRLTNGHKFNLVILVFFIRVFPFILGAIIIATLFPFFLMGLGLISILLMIGTFIFSSFIDMITSIALTIYYEVNTFDREI